ncbi:MAG: BatA domain-containing protein [Flavobacteriales bacterium]|nr:BatA domain-containing protein [Flavobacteriales bacterium]
MKFVYPEFLFALFAVAIPIIIHLFNFRKYKKIYFSNVSFLHEVKKESQSKSKLKHLLILCSRILAVAFMVFAFAQPFIPSTIKSNGNTNTVGIYIDNSYSMESTGEYGSLLTEAKTKAIELVKSYGKTDKFVICENSFSAGSQRKLTSEEAISKIEQIEISTETRFLSEVYSRINETLNGTESENNSIHILSDFQKTTSDIEKINSDTSIQTYFFLIQSEARNNLYVDSCWFENPTHLFLQQENLFVRIKNNSNQDLENIPVKLFINDKLVAPSNFSVKANDHVEITIHYKNQEKGIQNGKIELQDSPVTLDDIFYFSYSITGYLKVLEITEKDTFPQIRAIYNTDSIFQFSTSLVDQIDYSSLSNYNLIVLNQLKQISSGLASTLKNFIENGGTLTIIPAYEVDFVSYNSFFSQLSMCQFTGIDTNKIKISEINYKHPLYSSVFEGKPKEDINLPTINTYYTSSNSISTYKNPVLSLKNSNSILTDYKIKNGTVYVLSTSLDEKAGNFTKHALFVPTFFNMALLSQTINPLFYTIGKQEVLSLKSVGNDGTIKITKPNFEFIPQTKKDLDKTIVFVTQGITLAGNYILSENTIQSGLSYNYNRLESDLTVFSNEELSDLAKNSGFNAHLVESHENSINHALEELKNGKRFWKICIILALFFLAVEIALIKHFK